MTLDDGVVQEDARSGRHRGLATLAFSVHTDLEFELPGCPVQVPKTGLHQLVVVGRKGRRRLAAATEGISGRAALQIQEELSAGIRDQREDGVAAIGSGGCYRHDDETCFCYSG